MNAPALTRKFCEDCKFHATMKALGDTFHLCHAPQNERPTGMHLVIRDGEKMTWNCETAYIQRGSELAEYCGPEAKWFVSRKDAQVAS